MEQKGAGMFDLFLGAERIRGQRYEKWLEQRLVLVHNDVDYVNLIRRKFGFDKTNIVGRGQLTKEMVKKEVCDRGDDKKIIAPNMVCQTGGYRKTKKHKRRGRKGKRLSRKNRK